MNRSMLRFVAFLILFPILAGRSNAGDEAQDPSSRVSAVAERVGVYLDTEKPGYVPGEKIVLLFAQRLEPEICISHLEWHPIHKWKPDNRVRLTENIGDRGWVSSGQTVRISLDPKTAFGEVLKPGYYFVSIHYRIKGFKNNASTYIDIIKKSGKVVLQTHHPHEGPRFTYSPYQAVGIYLINKGAQTYTLPSEAPWEIRRNDRVIFKPQVEERDVPLVAGEWKGWGWEQVTDEGKLIKKETGLYYVHLRLKDSRGKTLRLSRQLRIQQSPGDSAPGRGYGDLLGLGFYLLTL